MNAQEHIDKAESLLADTNAAYAEYSMVKIKAAEMHLKLAKWKYEHGESAF